MKPNLPTSQSLYIEAGLEHIDDGSLLEQINQSIRTAYRMTEEWEHANEKDGSFEVTIKLSAERVSKDYYGLSAKVTTKTPALEIKQQMVRAANGRILCDKDGGTFHEDQDQLKLFSGQGIYVATVDASGEVIDDDPNIVGSVNPATAAGE